MPSIPARYTGFQIPVLPQGTVSSTSSKQSGMGMRQTSPLASYQAMHTSSGITKSPTMPDFRSLHSTFPNEHLLTRLKPILPNSVQGSNLSQYRPPVANYLPQIINQGNQNPGVLPPMTIIIQPPNPLQGVTNSNNENQHQSQVQSQDLGMQQSHVQHQQQYCPNHVQGSPVTTMVNSPPVNSFMDSSLPESPPKQIPNYSHGGASLPNTPTITISPGLPVLPSYIEARQQQSLQQKFASINVGKAEALIRSHSEENLQKAQKEKSELIQQNPFMGTLTNANSVPCVYVESQSTDLNDGSDSPNNLDSPSTSASYASSPPSVRPFWFDHSHSLNEFVFHEWPLEPSTSIGGTWVGYRAISPPHHHRSLTDLIQNPIPELNELSPSNRNKTLLHQLSLPSVAMTDLTTEEHEHMDRQNPESPSEFFMPADTDFDMEDSMMDLIKSEVPDLQSFDVSHMLNSVVQGSLLSSSPESYLHNTKS